MATLGGSDFLEIPNRRVKERDRTRKMSFPVSLSGCGTLVDPAQLSFSSKGKAKPGKDIKPKLGMATIPAGGTDGTVRLKVKGDAKDERTEKFTLTLRTASGDVLGTATGKIKDDD